MSNLIREAKIFQIPSIMQTGKKYGMCLMNESITDLVKRRSWTPRRPTPRPWTRPGLLNMFKKNNIDTSWAPADVNAPAGAG